MVRIYFSINYGQCIIVFVLVLCIAGLSILRWNDSLSLRSFTILTGRCYFQSKKDFFRSNIISLNYDLRSAMCYLLQQKSKKTSSIAHPQLLYIKQHKDFLFVHEITKLPFKVYKQKYCLINKDLNPWPQI